MQPSLSLSYSSESKGNGPLGVGWNIAGVSSITRCGSSLGIEGFVDGVDFSATPTDAAPDRFCLDGQKLVLLSGEDTLLINGEEALNDTRCAKCGSLLYSVVRDGEYAHVALGSLVDEPGMRPTKHIFVGSKAPWFEITDDLPQFEEHATA